MRPGQRSNTHGAVSLFRKKLICRALRVSTTPKPRCVTSVFLTSRHYVARMFARFIKLPRILHSRDFRVRICRGVSCAPCRIFNFHHESAFLSNLLAIIGRCSHRTDCDFADFCKITKRTRLVTFFFLFFSYVAIFPRGLLFRWKNGVLY